MTAMIRLGDMPMSRRLLGGLFGALAILAGLGAAGPAMAQTEISVGTVSTSELATPLYLAEERGWFRDAGLQVVMVDFNSDGSALQALVGGSIKICVCAVDHVARLQNRHVDGVLAVALDTRLSQALVARGDRAFTDLASLRGHRIGVAFPGSFADSTLRWALHRADMNPDRDVEILAAGTGATMRAAIDSARIDAGMMIASDLVQLLATAPENAYRIVLDLRRIPYPSLGLLARRGWLTREDSGAAAFTAAVVRGIEAIRADRTAAVAALKRQFPDFSAAAVESLAAELQQRLAPGGLLREAELANLNGLLSVVAPNVPAITLADAQPVKPAVP